MARVERSGPFYHVEVIVKARAVISTSRKKSSKKSTNKGALAGSWVNNETPAPLPSQLNIEIFQTRKEYLVKWAGYESDENTWEPEEHLSGCSRLLESFWSQIGRTDVEFPIGYTIDAPEEWIETESNFFNEVFKEAEEENRLIWEKEQQKKSRKSRNKKTKRSGVSLPAGTGHATDGLEPCGALEKERLVIRLPAKRKEVETVTENPHTDDSADLPSSKKLRAQLEAPGEEASNDEAVQIPTSPSPVPSDPTPSPPLQPCLHETSSSGQTVPPLPLENMLLPNVSPDNISFISGIPTKRRLAPTALVMSRPKDFFNPVLSQSHVQRKLPSSSFPAASKSTIANIQLQEPVGPTLAALNAPPSPRARQDEDDTNPSKDNQEINTYGGRESMTEIETGDNQDPASAADPFYDFMSYSLFTPPPTPPQTNRQCEETITSCINLRASADPVPSPPQDKPWTWSGGVYLNLDHDSSSPIPPACNVTLCDVTLPFSAGLSFEAVLSPLPYLNFATFHDSLDLFPILHACKPIQQFAQVLPAEGADARTLQTLGKYMNKKRKVVLVPVIFDHTVVGHIIVLSPLCELCEQLKVPAHMHTPSEQPSLIAALILWSLSPDQLHNNFRHAPSALLPVNVNIEPMGQDEVQWGLTIRTDPLYHHALRILNFPLSLHEWMYAHTDGCGFKVWWEGGDGHRRQPAIETEMLYAILCWSCARDVQDLADVRVIFVHVGAVKTLHRLPGLEGIMSELFDIQFYSYGTHVDIPPACWGIREIFPCGGVVTFTPEAIMDDYLGVLNRIRQIESHPLWTCYILPSVLGMVARHEIKDGLNDGDLPCRALFSAVEEGQISLMTSPKIGNSPTQSSCLTREEWIRAFWTHRPEDTESTFQSCLDTFVLKYGTMEKSELVAAMRDEISRDLVLMRQQPVFMESYRRYVVLDGEGYPKRGRAADGLEWTTVLNFDFRDDFFPKQQ